MKLTKTPNLQNKAQVTGKKSDYPRILVAEDDLEMRKMLVWSIKRKDYEVIECGDGIVLMKHLGLLEPENSAPNIDLVVSDIRMPGTNGLRVLEMAKDFEELPPIILITAYPDQETYDKAERLGARAVLAKPFDVDDLIDEITRILPSYRQLRQQVVSDRSKNSLQFPYQFVFRHVSTTSPIRDFIQILAAKLNRYKDYIEFCRFELIGSKTRNNKDNLYFVKIYLEIKGESLVSKQYSGPGEECDNVYLAIRMVFSKVTCFLRDYKIRNNRHRKHS